MPLLQKKKGSVGFSEGASYLGGAYTERMEQGLGVENAAWDSVARRYVAFMRGWVQETV